jgi:GNAT superfamily N-acetyltransferase
MDKTNNNNNAQGGQANRNIRLAQLDDKTALISLIETSVRTLQRNDYSPTQLEALLTHVYGVDTQLIKDGTYYIVEQLQASETGYVIVGAGGWSKRKTLFGGDQAKAAALVVAKEDNLLDPKQDPAKIRAFFVHPAWARQGVAGVLMQTCERAAKQAGFRRLELMATLTGVPFYKINGFEAVENIEINLPALSDNEMVTVPLTRMTKPIVE